MEQSGSPLTKFTIHCGTHCIPVPQVTQSAVFRNRAILVQAELLEQDYAFLEFWLKPEGK
jgi:hypothetical protein